jgi:uncharacterized protein YdeI (BOF family)
MTNCLKISLYLLLIFLLFSSFVSDIKASMGHIVINEIYYDAAINSSEWIEIYNPTSNQFSLKDWSLIEDSHNFIFPEHDISPYQYLVIAKSSILFQDEYSLVANYEWRSMGLNNDGDELVLKDNNQNVIDKVVYPNHSAQKGNSIERQPKGKDTDEFIQDFVEQPHPSPFIGLPSAIDLSLGEIKEKSIELNWTENQDDNFKNYILFHALNKNFIGAEEKIIDDRKETKIFLNSLKLGTNYFKIRVENREGGFWDSNIVVKGIYSSTIVINELFPAPHEPFLSPETNDEYIELYNSSSEDIDLEDWILEDLGGKRYIISKNTGKETIIAGFSYMLFYKSQTKISLNNDETESIHLFWPDGSLCSVSTEYPKAEYNMSWSRNFDGRWIFSTSATPGAENKITIKEEKNNNPAPDADLQIININDAKNQPKNLWVKVSGVVTATPGLFGKKVAYIQDEGGGIKIYFDDALWPDLNIGDKVVILGKISTSSGEYQIKVYDSSDVTIIGHTSQPEPVEHKINELGDFVGQLIKVAGKVTKISGSSVYLDDGSGTLRLYFYPTTGIKNLGLQEGDWVMIVGILSKTSSGLRLLPRNKEDIKITKQGKEEVKAGKVDPVAQILGAEKAYAASDYRTDPQPAEVKKKTTYLWGGIVFIVGLLFLATLMIFARIREKDAKDNQFF